MAFYENAQGAGAGKVILKVARGLANRVIVRKSVEKRGVDLKTVKPDGTYRHDGNGKPEYDVRFADGDILGEAQEFTHPIGALVHGLRRRFRFAHELENDRHQGDGDEEGRRHAKAEHQAKLLHNR